MAGSVKALQFGHGFTAVDNAVADALAHVEPLRQFGHGFTAVDK